MPQKFLVSSWTPTFQATSLTSIHVYNLTGSFDQSGQGHLDKNWPIKLNLTDSLCGAYSKRYVCLTSAVWRLETLADLESFRELTIEFETIFQIFEMKFILLLTPLLSVILNFWFKHLSSLDYNISTYQCCMAQSRKHLIKILFFRFHH